MTKEIGDVKFPEAWSKKDLGQFVHEEQAAKEIALEHSRKLEEYNKWLRWQIARLRELHKLQHAVLEIIVEKQEEKNG